MSRRFRAVTALTSPLTITLLAFFATASAVGNLTTYAYDGAGNLATLTLPDGTSVTYTYDAAQRLTKVADSLGNSVTYTQNLGRVENRFSPALPHQTVHAVFPHTAFRCSSCQSMRRAPARNFGNFVQPVTPVQIRTRKAA